MISYSQLIQEAMRMKFAWKYAFGRHFENAGLIVSEEEAVGMQISINSLFTGWAKEVHIPVLDFKPPEMGRDPVVHTVVLRDRLPTPKRGTLWVTIYGVKVVVV